MAKRKRTNQRNLGTDHKLHSSHGNDIHVTLDESEMVQSMVTKRDMSKLPRHYFQQGRYLGSVTIDEGYIISMEPAN